MATLKILIAFFLISALNPVNGQAISGSALPLDPDVRTGKLDNGFTYMIRKNTEPKARVQLYLVNKVGSILETDEQLGLAHFMEHMNFNGTKHFPKNALVNYLEMAGVKFGADLNAYTSFDETVYILPIPTDDTAVLENGMKIMREWAQEATLDSLEIEKERGVVLEEERLGRGAMQRMQDKYLPVVFNNSRYSKRLPIGEPDIIANFKHETLREFYTDWYRPDLQALIVVGDIDVDEVEKTIIDKFSDLKMPGAPEERPEYKVPLTSANQFVAVTDHEFPYTVMQVLIKHPEQVIKTSTDYLEATKRNLFNNMLGDRYDELAQQADPAFIQGGASIDGFMAGLDAFNAVVVAKPGELEKGFKAVWRETARVSQFGFTQTELDRAKQEYLIFIERALKEKDKTRSENLVNEYLDYFLRGQAAPGIEAEHHMVKEQLPLITLADINKLSGQFITEVNRDVVIMAPEKDSASLPSREVVYSWIEGIESEQLTAYVDVTKDKPLFETKPVAGKVTVQNEIPELGVTELTLSNGVKVVLKPTDFKNDEVRFNAFSPGGTSLYSDDDYESATTAATLVDNSGVGEFNPFELPKLLSGKIVSVTPYLRERAEGLQGSASPADLETALQLMHLYFTAPRKDTAIFKGYITKSKSALANRGDDPRSVFSDTISAVLGNYNPRRTGPSIQKIEKVDLEKAFAIYNERFADAGDFTFTFTGNFDVDSIRPLLETWLGSLPSTGREEQARDLGIKIPTGNIEKVVRKGSEQKASVYLVFSGDYTYTPENNMQLDALGDVLQFKLTERLRELESGVYSPGTRVSYKKFPTATYSLSVMFGCSVDNVDKLVNATLDEIAKIKSNGADSIDVEKFVIENKRSKEVQLKDNAFWLRYLSNSYENMDDPKLVLRYDELLNTVTPVSLKQASATYLSGENLIKMVLLPEQLN